jgi:hypothetical protein
VGGWEVLQVALAAIALYPAESRCDDVLNIERELWRVRQVMSEKGAGDAAGVGAGANANPGAHPRIERDPAAAVSAEGEEGSEGHLSSDHDDLTSEGAPPAAPCMSGTPAAQASSAEQARYRANKHGALRMVIAGEVAKDGEKRDSLRAPGSMCDDSRQRSHARRQRDSGGGGRREAGKGTGSVLHASAARGDPETAEGASSSVESFEGPSRPAGDSDADDSGVQAGGRWIASSEDASREYVQDVVAAGRDASQSAGESEPGMEGFVGWLRKRGPDTQLDAPD